MKTNVSIYDFRDTIMKLRPNNFSYEGLTILFDWFEQYEEDCETEVEFDPIGICCEFNEDTWEAIADNYSIDTSDDETESDGIATVENYLLDNTMLCGPITDAGTFVYAAF